MAQFTTNSGAFSTIKVGDATNTLQDLTAYLKSFEIGKGNDDVDGTSMAAGGAAIAESHYHGALTSSIKVKFVYNPVVAKVLRQIVASRTGFTVQVYSGSNAAPTNGDEIFQGSFTLLDVPMVYNPGQTVMLDVTFVPVDNGAIVPGYAIL